MREIKFRQFVWDDDSKEAGRMYDWDELLNDEVDSLSCVFVNQFSNTSPLMQYTGLKDKNGKEIYEGDLIQRTVGISTGQKRLVLFKNGMFQGENLPHVSGYQFNIYPIENGDKWEVIGNIYENPDLLGGEQ